MEAQFAAREVLVPKHDRAVLDREVELRLGSGKLRLRCVAIASIAASDRCAFGFVRLLQHGAEARAPTFDRMILVRLRDRARSREVRAREREPRCQVVVLQPRLQLRNIATRERSHRVVDPPLQQQVVAGLQHRRRVERRPLAHRVDELIPVPREVGVLDLLPRSDAMRARVDQRIELQVLVGATLDRRDIEQWRTQIPVNARDEIVATIQELARHDAIAVEQPERPNGRVEGHARAQRCMASPNKLAKCAFNTAWSGVCVCVRTRV